MALVATKFSSIIMVVEDMQRDTMMMAVYNVRPNDESHWLPGRVVRVRNPYVRMASDDSTFLRIDNPSQTCSLQPGLAPVCWNCLKISTAKSSGGCAKCAKAHYCSRACQEADWKENGHRSACAFVQLGRAVVPL